MEESPTNLPFEPMMVAPRIEALRAALGMSRAQFADSLGIDRSSYTKIANGAKPLLPKDAFRIYQLYGVDMNFTYMGQIGGVPVSLSKKLTENLTQGRS